VPEDEIPDLLHFSAGVQCFVQLRECCSCQGANFERQLYYRYAHIVVVWYTSLLSIFIPKVKKMQSDAKTVSNYLKEVPEERQEALAKLRDLCRDILQGYTESMEYGMPSYKRGGGEVEVAFASQKNYISLYILKQEVMDRFRDRLIGLNLGKGCIRYSKAEKIDFALVEQLLSASFQSDSENC
jgi:uncharacterized protein YdhG (YjbR/CyaY superfamily)